MSDYEEITQKLAVTLVVTQHGFGNFATDIVSLPFIQLNGDQMAISIKYWLDVIRERPNISGLLLAEILQQFETSVKLQRGLFSRIYDLKDAKFYPMEYLPTGKAEVDHRGNIAALRFKPHLLLIRMFQSHFEASKYRSDHLLKLFTRSLLVSLNGLSHASLHPYARLARFELVSFGLDVMKLHATLNSHDTVKLCASVLDGSLSWFYKPHTVPYGNNKLKMKTDHEVLRQVAKAILSTKYALPVLEKKRGILLLFLDHEISFLSSWLSPLNPGESLGTFALYKLDDKVLTDAYNIEGKLALNLVQRYKASSLTKVLKNLIKFAPANLFHEPEAVQYIASETGKTPAAVALWGSCAPIDAIKFFLPPYNKDPLVLQYAMRSIESYDPHLTFFYVPQIVQTLRYDELGYVRHYGQWFH
ncbi:unnamed protein product [Ambrosiozyma monospora]|uniref:Unnamed protein product n=1 Tax=Ambrosiozyma monospora TaxID=43982 RepID=A0ACB5TMR3_AMBMO|nr:unnamed protein product [Ambrosiozyma monospora]